jgi:hypothetical protein
MASSAVMLKGNHEDLLLRFLGGELDAGRHWFDYDGLDALADYGVAISDREASRRCQRGSAAKATFAARCHGFAS